MSEDKPERPSDPRPGGEPYYIDSVCPDCGAELVLYDSLTDAENRSSDALADPDCKPEQDVVWHDEWVCPDCLDGIHMDWPDSHALDG